jgi:hypothetical protein
MLVVLADAIRAGADVVLYYYMNSDSEVGELCAAARG